MPRRRGEVVQPAQRWRGPDSRAELIQHHSSARTPGGERLLPGVGRRGPQGGAKASRSACLRYCVRGGPSPTRVTCPNRSGNLGTRRVPETACGGGPSLGRGHAPSGTRVRSSAMPGGVSGRVRPSSRVASGGKAASSGPAGRGEGSARRAARRASPRAGYSDPCRFIPIPVSLTSPARNSDGNRLPRAVETAPPPAPETQAVAVRP